MIMGLYLTALMISCGVEALSLGDHLSRVYTKYDAMPMDAYNASSAGFKVNNVSCEPGLGVAFTMGGVKNKETPYTLYFTPQGQISGVGTDIYGSVFPNLVEKGYYVKEEEGRWSVAVGFRDPAKVCDKTARFSEVIGDRAVINPNTLAEDLPLSDSFASKAHFQPGSCFDGMGTHWFKDVTGQQSWVAQNLVPVVPMYDLMGDLNAIFFASATVQQSHTDANGWEPIPLINSAMCKNWCDSACTFTGTHAWSTMHWYFNPNDHVKCPTGPKVKCFLPGVGCCPTNNLANDTLSK